MSAETLRRAAALMRERAAAATAGPWLADVLGSEGYAVREVESSVHRLRRVRVARCGYEDWDTDKANADHIASWHPAAALAVAKAIDDVADAWEICDDGWTRDMDDDAIRFEDTVDGGWLAVARAYLGESDRA